MKTQVFSFSTKTEKDEELVRKLKKEASLTGRSFSHMVLEALHEAQKSKTKATESV